MLGKWLLRLNIEEPTVIKKICKKHFRPGDFEKGQRLRLKKNVVPLHISLQPTIESQDVREGDQEARRVEAIVKHLPQEHWQTGQQGVEAPVLGEMRDDDGPDWFAGQHGPPGRRSVRDLSVRQTDGVLEILQLLLRDLPVLIRRVLDTEPP